MLGIWCCFFLLVDAAVFDKSSSKRHGGIPLELILNNIAEEGIDWGNINVEAEERLHHSKKLPIDPEAYMDSV